MYAKVIVDVPAKQTNRAFDYSVPSSMKGWIEVGSRVGVPFGPRVLQGFVVELHDTTSVDPKRLKAVRHILDPAPPLTEELVELGHWMSETYLCHEVTALQAMLPGALKAKYERYVQVADIEADGSPSMLLLLPSQERIIDYLQRKTKVKMEDLLEAFPEDGGLIRDMLEEGLLLEKQGMKDRGSAKKALTVFPPGIKIKQNEAASVSHHEETRSEAGSPVPAAESPADSAASREPLNLARLADELPARSHKQKEVLLYLSENLKPIRLTELMDKLQVGASTVKGLADRGWIELREVEVMRDPYANRHFEETKPLPLTDEQQSVYDTIAATLDRREHQVYLLQGVTGSGKTEVYLQAISRCLEQGREAIVLVPEISLTPQMVERFKGRFGDEVAVMHSRLSAGERYDEWRKIMRRQVRVVIGARSAVFVPFRKIGLIIIDEEHESSYKQEESPKYHARDVAAWRARYHGAAVVLGSATPSLESIQRTRPAAGAGSEYKLLMMPSRVAGRPLPPVHIVDMREELRSGNRSMFSRALHRGLEQRLQKGEQTVLLLNRRGYATFVMCRTCGFVAGCPHCDISLTYHQVSRTLRCHYCGYAERQMELCPDCGSEHIRHFGTGTQRVEEELVKLFPGIRVIRMDVDTTTEKGSHEKWLTMFRNKQADVLLGTQMVAKGLDFPDVTLVGVIAADTVLNLPDFRSAERTFQLLTQVAGRAGRHTLPGEVFVQTYTPEHYSVITASRHDYDAFIAEELPHRRQLGYPPYCRLILVTITHEQIPLLVRTAEALTMRLRELGAMEQGRAASCGEDFFMDVLGPVASPIPRIKDRYRFQCVVKYRGEASASRIVSRVLDEFAERAAKEKMLISVDVDPQMLM
ncbi:primosomal protein N' [Paenibacillus lutrae]|uniref:Replication restart protein PriA n=1 Tax=Paenibacillus lutrae TaxID=2078573 RepID=A0A7X3FGH6_9BACL|nr:primosomal protein N' [Paenibacillus lutrae]MVO99232.1 primosomal protein N' [Paenibacillus lutrae]